MALLGLLRVPAEIRLRIYGMVFREAKVIIHTLPQEPQQPADKADEPAEDRKRTENACRRKDQRTCISLLLTCRKIAEEAMSTFLKETTFMINDCPCWKSDSCHFKPGTFRILPDLRNIDLYSNDYKTMILLQQLRDLHFKGQDYRDKSGGVSRRLYVAEGPPRRLKTLRVMEPLHLERLVYFIFQAHIIAEEMSIFVVHDRLTPHTTFEEALVHIVVKKRQEVTIPGQHERGLESVKEQLLKVDVFRKMAMIVEKDKKVAYRDAFA
ncbi:hypothetical protein PMZ80_003061 [Knufia obscura]|uniref:DUF7730 domain-containing protein n=2 Tax=Knufia TaxID=430999 RepID=A0AAN8ERR6_9EURO|nr:hypothetical protein PMZ80_003061 [Knufia obscura]KAK5952351.1 hypothetical protein OHC33_006394 [Knufia fluminis]